MKRDTTQMLIYEDISIQGAYAREIKQGVVYPSLYFRMSKE